jgi:hypothetical protein
MSTFSSGSATVVKVTFNGGTASGGVSIPGLQTGDVILNGLIDGEYNWPSFANGYEPVVSTPNELQQSSALDWSGVLFTLYLLRGV